MPGTPFYRWSIAELWDWLIHVPFLGFGLALAIVLMVWFLVWLLRAVIRDAG